MNRATLLTAAGLLSAALIGATGCEQDKTESARVGSARGETMQASGQPGIGAKRGTGTSASGVTTGNATTGAPAAAGEATASSSSASAPNARASASAKDAGSPSIEGRGPSGINEQNTVDAAASPVGASASASVNAPPAAAETAVGTGPSGVNESPRADAAPAAAAQAPAADAQPAAAADKADKKDEHADAWAEVKPSAAAPKDMQVTGTVKFAKADHGVKVMVDLKGLTPNGKHGFHIHEKGDLSDPKLMSVGPHFNPEGKKHGGAKGDERHGGDLGNITADDEGNVKTTIMAHGITIDDEKTGIVGRSIIVHAKPDDEKTDPSGNSGDRIAGGAIEKPAKKDAAGKSAGAGTASEAQPAAAETAEAGPSNVNESTTPDAATAQPREELNK